jgi:dihydrodipicolinate synthase/N-acetylneuraminate lyase
MLQIKMSEQDKNTGRFHYFVTVFRVTGLPLLLGNVPLPFRLYAAVATVCCYASYFSQVVDLVMNTRDLERTMETARIIAGAGMTVWIYGFLR